MNNLFFLSRPQSPSSLPGYVSACAYSPPNQYGVYGGPSANYMSTGHHWQPQSPNITPTLTPSLTQSPARPGTAAPLEAADFHTAACFKLQQREGELNAVQTDPDVLFPL